MNSKAGALAGLVLTLFLTPARADGPLCNWQFHRLQNRLCGCILDFTNNHGADRRQYSQALGQKRDLYVYLPPGYDPCRRYPVMIWLHGFRQDEAEFLSDVVGPLDKAICNGTLPPLVVAAPDGTLQGHTSLFLGNSFFINSLAGCFEDYILCDIWPFLLSNFSIHPDRKAHILGGVSMGGFAAYNLSIKYQDQFSAAMGIFPPLNLRWVNCHGRYWGNFDPCCWGWRDSIERDREVIGRFAGGLVKIRLRRMIVPLYDHLPDAIERLSRENPIEMLLRGEVQPGAVAMWVGYGGMDQFNLDAQVESFLHVARTRGFDVAVWYSPRGRHDFFTARRMIPSMICWLGQQLAPFSQGPQQACTIRSLSSPSTPGCALRNCPAVLRSYDLLP